MGEERLKEITMEVIKLDEPLPVMTYINNLSHSEIHLFLNYIKSSKYSELDIYTAVMRFSLDYLKSIKCPAAIYSEWNNPAATVPKSLL